MLRGESTPSLTEDRVQRAAVVGPGGRDVEDVVCLQRFVVDLHGLRIPQQPGGCTGSSTFLLAPAAEEPLEDLAEDEDPDDEPSCREKCHERAQQEDDPDDFHSVLLLIRLRSLVVRCESLVTPGLDGPNEVQDPPALLEPEPLQVHEAHQLQAFQVHGDFTITCIDHDGLDLQEGEEARTVGQFALDPLDRRLPLGQATAGVGTDKLDRSNPHPRADERLHLLDRLGGHPEVGDSTPVVRAHLRPPRHDAGPLTCR